MVAVIDHAVRPRFSRHVSFALDDHEVRIEDGTYRAAFPAGGVTLPDLDRLAAGVSPDELVAGVRGWLGCGEPDAIAVIERLFSTGLLVDPEAARLDSVPGSYVACRLVDAFRREFPRVVSGSPLLRDLAAGRDRGLALGFLLETYFVVRAAVWTTDPVFRHPMTPAQREALDDFRASESGHGELLLGGFSAAGFDTDALRRSQAAVETLAYAQSYGAFAWQGVAEFAASLVLPEVPALGADPAAPGVDVLDLIEQRHGVPGSLIARFRAHDAEDVEADHGGLPGILLSEERDLTPAKVERLFVVLRHMMDLYRSHLDAVHRRYAHWDPDAAAGPELPDNALRF
ncbi:hypothetical protein [Streptomyces marincola]|uniref:hypothetical protein n=1 Tax=Streptomyces marincola TaxID=2878388 RepID=UPI001CF49E09|nr:hypothetical protein [Streptomyces marincola]UCM88677.1 hypothetical protein LC193_12325 [Streptomyces marincola]